MSRMTEVLEQARPTGRCCPRIFTPISHLIGRFLLKSVRDRNSNHLARRYGNATFTQSSLGRHHMPLLGTTLNQEALDLQATAVWRPLVDVDPSSVETSRHTISLAQLLDSRGPQSQPQIWHADNTRGGFTVVVALCDVHAENGPTAIQLGSHHSISDLSLQSLWRAWWRPTLIATPHLRKGDVLVYAASAIHRGEANPSSHSRPVLVYRYDAPSKPAPGVGALGAQAINVLGWLLSI